MGEMTLQQILDIVQSFGVWALFAWLYMNEKRAHEDTRRQYRADLRAWAGMTDSLIVKHPDTGDPP